MAEFTPDIFTYPYGTFLMTRPEFILLRDDELQAKLMRIVEGWMMQEKIAWTQSAYEAINKNEPVPPEPEEYWATISTSQFIAQLYRFDSATEKEKNNTISKGTLRKALHALIEDGVLLTRPNPDPDEVFKAAQYTLNRPLVQKLLDSLPKGASPYMSIFGGHTPFTAPGGVPKNVTPPTYKFWNPPLTNFGTPHLQILEPLIDRVIDPRIDHEERDSPFLPDTAASGVDAIAQRPSFSPLFADTLVSGNEWEVLLSIYPDAPEVAQPSYSQEPTTNDESALRADVATMPIGNIQSESAGTTLPVSLTGGAGDLTQGLVPPQKNVPVPLPAPASEEKLPKPKTADGTGTGTGKPQMPDGKNAQWTAETFVQVCEARRGRRYPNGAKLKKDRLRDRELVAADELLKPEMAADLWTGDTTHNIQLLCQICDHLETRKKGWWKETNGPVQPHQLLDKDRVHTMYDEMVQLGKLQVIAGGGSDMGGSTAPHPGGDVAPPEQSRVGVSGRLRVVATSPLVVVPPRRKERPPRAARAQQEVMASAGMDTGMSMSMRRA